ncbi:ThiF domain-containing protein, partial [Trichostrongylus colubriformis]
SHCRTFADARKTRSKAETAAAALQRIYPSIESEAVLLTVLMPGYTVAPREEAALVRDVEAIEQLVCAHDVVFLCFRQSRSQMVTHRIGQQAWQAIVFRWRSLGFDNYVVIRHGVRYHIYLRWYCYTVLVLACYFCSGVTAAGNSSTDRTLDQQCTV